MAESPALTETSALAAAGASVTPTALRIDDPENLPWDEFERLGDFLGTIGRAYPWWVGDFLNYGEAIFGEEFAQIEAMLPHSPQTLTNYKSVAKHIPRSRRKALPYSVQAEVAYVEPKVRDQWLEKAEHEGWKRDDMRDARRDAKAAGSELPLNGPVSILPPMKPKLCPHCGRPM